MSVTIAVEQTRLFDVVCVSGSVPTAVRRENKRVNRVKVIGRTAVVVSQWTRPRAEENVYYIFVRGRCSCAPDRARQFDNSTICGVDEIIDPPHVPRPRMTSPKSRDRSTGHNSKIREAGCYRCHPPATCERRVYDEESSTVKSPTKSPGRTICRISRRLIEGVFFLFRRKTVNLHRTKTLVKRQNYTKKRRGSFLFLEPFLVSARGTLALFRRDGVMTRNALQTAETVCNENDNYFKQ